MPRVHVTTAIAICERKHVPRFRQPINQAVNHAVYVLLLHYAVIRGILYVCATNLIAAIQLLRDADAHIILVCVLLILTFLVRVISSVTLLNGDRAIIYLQHLSAVHAIFRVNDYFYRAVIAPLFNVLLLVIVAIPSEIASVRGFR